MRFRDYLILEKRNPHKDSFLSVAEHLSKYKDRDDIFISFTSEEKVGVNPQTKYSTPSGVYSYPLKKMWDDDWLKTGFIRVPFAGDQENVQILKLKKSDKNIYDISKDYSKKQFAKDTEKLKKIIKDEKLKLPSEYDSGDFDIDFLEFLKDTEKGSNNNSYGGVMFYLIYQLGKGNSSKIHAFQTKIWRQLGYNFIGDISGAGIIHTNERIQALFLDKSSYEHIDSLKNKDYQKLKFVNKLPEDLQQTAGKMINWLKFNDWKPLTSDGFDEKKLNKLLDNETFQEWFLKIGNYPLLKEMIKNPTKDIQKKVLKNGIITYLNKLDEDVVSDYLADYTKHYGFFFNFYRKNPKLLTSNIKKILTKAFLDKEGDNLKMFSGNLTDLNIKFFDKDMLLKRFDRLSKGYGVSQVPDWIKKMPSIVLDGYEKEHPGLEKKTKMYIGIEKIWRNKVGNLERRIKGYITS